MKYQNEINLIKNYKQTLSQNEFGVFSKAQLTVLQTFLTKDMVKVGLSKAGEDLEYLEDSLKTTLEETYSEVEEAFLDELNNYIKLESGWHQEYLEHMEDVIDEKVSSKRDTIITILIALYLLGTHDLDENRFDVNVYAIDRIANDAIYWMKQYPIRFLYPTLAALLENPSELGIEGYFDELSVEILSIFEGRGGVGGWGDRGRDYYGGVGELSVTRGLIFGQLEAMQAAGIQEYEIVEILDEVTCDFCEAINGTKFLVSDGVNLMTNIITMSQPDDIRKNVQWMKGKEFNTVVQSEGLGGLINRGLQLPPYHISCRGRIRAVR